MIGVVVPAHNEAEHIGPCLQALRMSARCPRLKHEVVQIVVVLDACTDETQSIVRF